MQKTDLSKELNSQGVDKGNDSGLYRDFIENENGNYVKSRDWESNGTGLLPSGIKTTTPTSSTVKWPQHTDSDKLDKATKDLEKELENWIRDDLNQKTASGNGVGGDQNQSTSTSGSSGDRTSSSGRTGTDTSGQESSTPISNSVVSGAAEDPNSMVSLVSVGINGPLNLEQRGKLRDLIINIQKEEMENVQDGSGQYKPLNIPPEYVMCLMQAESSMNPVATSPTGAAGLGQFTDDSQKEGTEMMKKMSPKHYEEFSKKYGKDLTQAMSTKASGSQNVKNTLRKDANLAAAMTYDFVQVKARNVLKLNGPVSMNDLQRITYRYIGDGNEGSQWNYIRKCMTNN